MPHRESDYAAMMKAAVIEANKRKVQRRKEEQLFVKGIGSNFQLSHLSTIREELSNRQFLIDEKFSSRPQTPSPPREEPIRCVGGFTASVRCFEPTHGGSCLWTGESDGSIGIRNGVTGELAYQLGAIKATDATGQEVSVLVDCLWTSDNNMFVGCSNGSIRVYDVSVFVLALEATEHSGSVCAFTSSFDQRTFSISTDGSMAKWDTEANNFSLLSKVLQPNVSFKSITSYGYHVFVGADEGGLYAFDTDTLEVTKTYVGHVGSVNCVVVQDGYLFSGGNDTSIIVWNIASGEALKSLSGHSSPISGLFKDTNANQLWSVDLSGNLSLWSTCDTNDFELIRSAVNDDGSEVFGLKGMTVLEAAKVWTLGSNGVNKVWHTSTNRVESGIRNAIGTMRGIIEQDEIELQKWDDLAKTLQALSIRVDNNIGTALEHQTQHALRLRSFMNWMSAVKRNQVRRVQRRLAQVMEDECHDIQRRTTIRLWTEFAQRRIRDKRNIAVVNLLRAQHDQRLLAAYASTVVERLNKSVRHVDAQRHSEELLTSTNRSVLARAFTALLKNRFARQARTKRQQMANVLETLSSRRVLCRSFCDWAVFHAKRQRIRLLTRSMKTMSTSDERNLMYKFWSVWRRKQQKSAHQTIVGRSLQVLCAYNERLKLSQMFRRWITWSKERSSAAAAIESSANRSKIAQLDITVQSMSHLLQRRSLLNEADELIRRALEQREAKLAQLQNMKDDIAKLSDELNAKKNRIVTNVEKTLEEQVADLISLLKCRLLNFVSDYPAMLRTAERIKRVGASKVFLEAHQAVKRVVVEMTKEGYLPTDAPWPLTDRLISRMKNHHAETVLAAIKTMIIAYDALNLKERSSLTTDEEIVINAHNLHLLADQCLAVRAKRNRR